MILPSPLPEVRQPPKDLRIRCGWFDREGRCPNESDYYFHIAQARNPLLACCRIHALKVASNDTLTKKLLTYEEFVTMGVMAE